jgi:hypothetical protein
VIERDAGHHGAIGVVGIDRIEAAAEPDFENQHFDLAGAKDFHRRQRTELEVGQRDLTGAWRAASTRAKASHRQRVVYRLPIDAHPLVVGEQMRRGIATDAVTGKAVDGFEVGAGRALAVGAADGDHRALQMLGQFLP